MNRCFIMALDNVRARFFKMVDSDTPETESGPDLVETGDLLNPESDMSDEDVFTETKTGANMSSGNGKMHQYDDHRTKHNIEFARRFADKALTEGFRRAERKDAKDLILVANPSMLGLIRPMAEQKGKGRSLTVHTVSKEVSKLSGKHIHEILAEKQLVPARRSASGQMGTRRRHA